jgi:hypothetical protein
MTARAPDRRTDEEFIELVCSDEDLLAAEFDAIIAANWPGRPPAPPADLTRVPEEQRHGRSPSSGRVMPGDTRGAVVPARSRQRSPPGTGSSPCHRDR